MKKKINRIKESINSNIDGIFISLILLLLIFSIINLFPTFISGINLNSKIAEIKESNRPANIELLVIKADNCANCFDISDVVESIKKENTNITKEETIDSGSDKAKQLISKYNLNKLPALLILGEINKTKLNGFENLKDALVFNQIKPLYIDANTGKIIGEVKIINVIDTSCEKCITLSTIPDSLKKSGVIIKDIENIEYSSLEGKELIEKFNIKHIPAILISNEINYYPDIKQSLLDLNITEKNSFYAMHSTTPPYRNLTSNIIEGLVDLIILTDNSCKDCYDVTINKQILNRLGVVINTEKTYDVSSSEGIELISKYQIKKAPIILLSPSANVYPLLVQAWKSVGTIEEDGWFVMRSPEALGKSKSLS